MKRSHFCTTIIAAASLFVGILPLCAQQPATTAVYGGRGGSDFSDSRYEPGARVLEVHVWAGDHVDAVRMIFVLSDGRTVTGPQHGGSGGGQNVFRLDSDEYVVGLAGRYGEYIDSLQIITNKRTSRLFGGRGGNSDFRIDVPSGNQAVGFAGRAGDFMDAIGLVYVPIRQFQTGSGNFAGGRGGSPFADQDMPPGARISEVRVAAGDRIDSVQIVYALSDGRQVEGPRHGGRGGRINVFRLDSDEYIVAIAGRCGNNVDSLQIITNKRSSPMFGGGGGNRSYRFDVPAGNQAIGFAGRAGAYLDSISLAYGKVTFAPSRDLPGRRRPRP